MQRSYHFAMAERSRLSELELVQLGIAAHPTSFENRQFIQHRGDAGNCFWAIASGHVQIGRHSEDGEFTNFAVLGAGDMFGELAFFTGVPRQVDAIASGSVKLFKIDRPLLRQLIIADAGWLDLLLCSLSQQLATALDLVDAGRRLSATERLGNLLAVMARESDTGDTVLATQQQLAELLGVSRVTLGSSLAELTGRGLIERKYRHIRLLRPDASDSS
jgi:CRP-like cAMP-binding protein